MKQKLLSEILHNVAVLEKKNYCDKKISHVTHNSRKIKAEGLFVAVRGFETDGHNYLYQAVANQAAAAIARRGEYAVGMA